MIGEPTTSFSSTNLDHGSSHRRECRRAERGPGHSGSPRPVRSPAAQALRSLRRGAPAAAAPLARPSGRPGSMWRSTTRWSRLRGDPGQRVRAPRPPARRIDRGDGRRAEASRLRRLRLLPPPDLREFIAALKGGLRRWPDRDRGLEGPPGGDRDPRYARRAGRLRSVHRRGRRRVHRRIFDVDRADQVCRDRRSSSRRARGRRPLPGAARSSAPMSTSRPSSASRRSRRRKGRLPSSSASSSGAHGELRDESAKTN